MPRAPFEISISSIIAARMCHSNMIRHHERILPHYTDGINGNNTPFRAIPTSVFLMPIGSIVITVMMESKSSIAIDVHTRSTVRMANFNIPKRL